MLKIQTRCFPSFPPPVLSLSLFFFFFLSFSIPVGNPGHWPLWTILRPSLCSWLGPKTATMEIKQRKWGRVSFFTKGTAPIGQPSSNYNCWIFFPWGLKLTTLSTTLHFFPLKPAQSLELALNYAFLNCAFGNCHLFNVMTISLCICLRYTVILKHWGFDYTHT